MTTCWYEDSDERPSFDELAAELEKVLSTMVGYVELNMELVPITEDEHSKQSSLDSRPIKIRPGTYCMVIVRMR